MGVSKATLGEPAIAQAMIQGGVEFIADSRLENIQKMKQAGISIPFVLLRTALSQAESVVQSAEISLNTELETIKAISGYAERYHRIHKIIVMVELGDLREGILVADLPHFLRQMLRLPQIELMGIGCNLACYGGVRPSDVQMQRLSQITRDLEREFGLCLEIVSGGNSANYDWSSSTLDVGRVNNLRLGEAILLGCETVYGKAIPGLHTRAFRLVAEVIESKQKPSLPFGEVCRDAFGQMPQFRDRGIHQRVIVALGRQDMLISGLTPGHHLEILGASSDHTVMDSQGDRLSVGSEVGFDLDYGGLLAAMTSPFVRKQYSNTPVKREVTGEGTREVTIEVKRESLEPCG